MPRQQERTMFAYSLHGRTSEGVIDYQNFFSGLSRVPAPLRQTSVGTELVAITYMSRSRGGWLMRFLAGEQDMPALFYDPDTGEESLSTPDGRRFAANANWVYVDLTGRVAAIERRRPGVAVGVMARALSHLGSELGIAGGRVTFDLNPVVAKTFSDAVEDFERIRQASIVLARPNFNWADNAGDLTGYADESNADDVEVAMSARRGESLSKDHGIISDILNVTKAVLGPVKNLRVVGRRTGETKETAISLKRHQEKRSFPVPTVPNLQAEREGFEQTAAEFVRDVASREVGSANG